MTLHPMDSVTQQEWVIEVQDNFNILPRNTVHKVPQFNDPRTNASKTFFSLVHYQKLVTFSSFLGLQQKRQSIFSHSKQTNQLMHSLIVHTSKGAKAKRSLTLLEQGFFAQSFSQYFIPIPIEFYERFYRHFLYRENCLGNAAIE